MQFPRLALAAVLVPAFLLARGETEVTHVRVSGDRENGTSLPIEKYNRIYFTDDKIVLASSSGDVSEVYFDLTQFPFIDFHTDANSIDGVTADVKEIAYDAASDALTLAYDMPGSYTVMVCDLSGRILSKGNPDAGGRYYVAGLTSGTYIAIAVRGNEKYALKFIKNN